MHPYRGKDHGTKFIEMLEKEVKKVKISQISAFPVTDDGLEHILREKRGWILTRDRNGDKRYTKKTK